MAEEGKDAPLAIENKAHNTENAVTSMEVNGDAVKLDSLGPMIINSDGTISRITNWGEMTQMERERTVRVLVKKRNLVRLKKLSEEAKQDGAGEGDQAVSALQDSKSEPAA